MRLRLNTKWHNKGKEVSIEDKANTMAFIAWKIAAAFVLDMENENFQTDTQAQRLDMIKEAMALLISATDRLVADQYTQDERQRLITQMAIKSASTLQENSEDLIAKGADYKAPYIQLLNERMSAYAGCGWDNEKQEPGFQYKRDFGDYVSKVMGAKDNKWITQFIIEVEVPVMMDNLKKAKNQMVDGRSEAALGD